MTKDEVTALSPKAQLSLLSRPGLLRTLEKAPLLASGAGMLRKFVAWTQPVAIKDVKTTGAPHGAKVNHTTLRAMVPVDLRPASHLGQLGNEFGLVILELAVNQALAVRRALLGRSPHQQHVALDTAPWTAAGHGHQHHELQRHGNVDRHHRAVQHRVPVPAQGPCHAVIAKSIKPRSTFVAMSLTWSLSPTFKPPMPDTSLPSAGGVKMRTQMPSVVTPVTMAS